MPKAKSDRVTNNIYVYSLPYIVAVFISKTVGNVTVTQTRAS